MGALFMLPAVVYLIMIAKRHADARTGADYMGALPAIGGLCFGLVMMIKPDKFDEILQLLLSLLLVVLGLFHVIYLLMSRENLKIKGWYYICPLIVALCGILTLALPSLRQNRETMVLITGICLLLFNFTSLQEYLAERRVRRALVKTSDGTAIDDEAAISNDDSSLVETTIEDDEIE
jgi:uncharacterized membrane protein HdeD (DUF308 family)